MITAELHIGDAQYPAIGDFRLTSRRGQPLTVLTTKVPLSPVSHGDRITLKYGYADTATWNGTVTNIDKGGDLMQVTASGTDELLLTETSVTESFVDEIAEAIVRTALSATGLSIGTLDAPGVPLSRFTADSIPVWQVVRQVEESLRFGHGLKGYALWVGAKGVMWTTGDEPGNVPEIITGKNLIEHAPSDIGFSRLTTFLLPGLAHSRRFYIKDTRRDISGEYRIEMVRHELQDVQARTHIYYRGSA